MCVCVYIISMYLNTKKNATVNNFRLLLMGSTDSKMEENVSFHIANKNLYNYF